MFMPILFKPQKERCDSPDMRSSGIGVLSQMQHVGLSVSVSSYILTVVGKLLKAILTPALKLESWKTTG